jgi:hypothetical protein
MGTRNITLDMSPDLIHASKPIIKLLIDADVIFFWQYFAEPQKIIIETADLPPTASNTGGHGGILNAALIVCFRLLVFLLLPPSELCTQHSGASGKIACAKSRAKLPKSSRSRVESNDIRTTHQTHGLIALDYHES